MGRRSLERFNFAIHADGILVPDKEGIDLTDAKAAAAELRASARDLCTAHPGGMIEMTVAHGKSLIANVCAGRPALGVCEE